MSDPKHEQARKICDQIAALPAGPREAALAEFTRDDSELRTAVVRLIQELTLAADESPRPAASGDARAAGVGPASDPPNEQLRPLSTRRQTSGGGSVGPQVMRRLQPGMMLHRSRYEIIQYLGRGGMGEIFKAYDTRNDEEVALKFLTPELARSGDAVMRLRDEVRHARNVKDRYCCRLNEFVDPREDDPSSDLEPFISMEFIDGEDLASLLKRIKRLPDLALKIAHELGNGLVAIHAAGLIHRDLKPANVMLDRAGVVRILDFGIARPQRLLATANVVAGTPAYMAPEVPQQGDSRQSDLYSLGLVLFELVTGRSATVITGANYQAPQSLFSGETPHPAITPEFEQAILSCLEKDPANRVASARDFLRALPPLEGEDEGPVRGWSTIEYGEHAPRLSPRHTAMISAAIAIGILIYCICVMLAGASSGKLQSHLVLIEVAQSQMKQMGATLDPNGSEAYGYEAVPARLPLLGAADPAQSGGANAGQLRTARQGGVSFWYRWSPKPIVPRRPTEAPRSTDPALNEPGSAFVRLHAADRTVLERWHLPSAPLRAAGAAVAIGSAATMPATSPSASPATTPNLTCLLPLPSGGLWTVSHTPEPNVRSYSYWVGDRSYYTGLADVGTPPQDNWLALVQQRAGSYVRLGWNLLPIVFGLWLAVRGLRKRVRSSRQAWALARLAFLLQLTAWLLLEQPWRWHLAAGDAFVTISMGLGYALFMAAAVWMFYVAIDPHAREVSHGSLVSYARFAADWRRFYRDPIVARSVLTGLLGGVIFSLLRLIDLTLTQQLSLVPSLRQGSEGSRRLLSVLGNDFGVLGLISNGAVQAVYYTLLQFIILVLLVKIRGIRNPGTAGLIFIGIVGPLWAVLMGMTPQISLPICFLVAGLVAFLLLQEGVLAVMACMFYVMVVPRLLDVTLVYGFPTFVPLLALAAVATGCVLAARACLTDRSSS